VAVKLIIDAHTHLSRVFDPMFGFKYEVEQLLQAMDKHNIDKAVTFPLPGVPDLRDANDYVSSCVQRYPSRLVGFACVNPYLGDQAEAELERCFGKLGLKGLKLHPLAHAFQPNAKIVHPLIEKAKKYRVPVIFHTGNEFFALPSLVGDLAESFPEVTIIIAHMGIMNYVSEALIAAKKNENILLETSNILLPVYIEMAVETVGAERVVFGSDTPASHMAVELKKLEVAGLKESEIKLILGENMRKILE